MLSNNSLSSTRSSTVRVTIFYYSSIIPTDCKFTELPNPNALTLAARSYALLGALLAQDNSHTKVAHFKHPTSLLDNTTTWGTQVTLEASKEKEIRR